jgi:hypothetical protein
MADRTKADVFTDLVSRIKAGQFDLASDDQRIAFLVKELKMSTTQATSFYNNVVRASVTSQAPTPIPGGVLDPSGLPSGGFGVSDPDILGRQSGRQQFLRAIMGATGRPLGGFGADAQGALGTAFGQFQDIDPITRGSYFTGTPERERGLRFQDFLSGGGSGDASLRQSLGGLLTGFQGGDVEQVADFMTRFPTASRAARAGIQPYLTGVAPRQREAMANNLLNLIEPRLFTTPGQFQSPEQIAGVLKGILEQIAQPGVQAGTPPI